MLLLNKGLLRAVVSSHGPLISSDLHFSRRRQSSLADIYHKGRGSKQAAKDAVTKPADWDTAIPYDKMPGPAPLPFIGNTLVFLPGLLSGNFADVFKNINNKYGSIAAIKGIPRRKDLVLLFKASDTEKLFRNEGIWPYREILPSLTEYRMTIKKDHFGNSPGIVSQNGEDWFNTRSKLNPILMQPRNILNYTESVDEVATDMIKIITKFSKESSNNQMPKNFEDFIQNWALETVCCLAFDRRLGCLDENPRPETKELIEAVFRIFAGLHKLDLLPMGNLMKKLKTKSWRVFVNDMDYLTDTSMKLINEEIKRIQKNTKTDTDRKRGILEQMLTVDKQVAISMATDMVLAGVDTTTKASAIALYHLAKNNEAQSKLREELMSLMPSPGSPVTVDVINNASYLKAAIKESMRLTPVALGNLRTINKDLVLGGYQIPKRVDVMPVNSVISISEEYFERPNEFLPDRWLRTTTGELSRRNTSAFVSLPFGFGPRSCIGQRFANLELQVFIAKVIRNFTLEWPAKDMKFTTSLTHGCASPLEFKMVPVSQ